MEKQLSLIGYWLGLTSTFLALILRFLTAFHMIPSFFGVSGGNAISSTSFLHGGALFFLLSIASWCRTNRVGPPSRSY